MEENKIRTVDDELNRLLKELETIDVGTDKYVAVMTAIAKFQEMSLKESKYTTERLDVSMDRSAKEDQLDFEKLKHNEEFELEKEKILKEYELRMKELDVRQKDLEVKQAEVKVKSKRSIWAGVGAVAAAIFGGAIGWAHDRDLMNQLKETKEEQGIVDKDEFSLTQRFFSKKK